MAGSERPTEPDAVELGEYIRAQREGLGISQRRLAARAGIHHSYLARMEAGDYARPAPAVLHRIAEALDLEPEDLFALAGHTIPHELPSFAPYLRAKYDIPDLAAQELADYFRYMTERYGIRERTEPLNDTEEGATH
jgi:transcriptional regulator with XRE-family HTH domain